MDLLSNSALTLLQRSLDAASLRQKVIANNVANVDTPYFKRSEVQFEDLLQNEMNGMPAIQGYRTDPRHFYIGAPGNSLPQPNIVTDNHSVMNNNMNNVDIDFEMSQMAKNQLRYDVMIQQANENLKQLGTVINGGK